MGGCGAGVGGCSIYGMVVGFHHVESSYRLLLSPTATKATHRAEDCSAKLWQRRFKQRFRNKPRSHTHPPTDSANQPAPPHPTAHLNNS